MKTLYVLLLLLPGFIKAQVPVYTSAQTDSAIRAAISKIVFPASPASSLDTVKVQKMINTSLNTLDSLVVKHIQGNTSGILNLDTVKIPVNTAVEFDMVVTAVRNSDLAAWSSPWHILLSNVNGVYTIHRQGQPLGQSGIVFMGPVVSVGPDKAGMVVFGTAKVATPLTWTIIYSPKKISK